MKDTERLTAETVKKLATEAVEHVDKWGIRGVTDLSVDQIEALVIVAAFALPMLGSAEKETLT